MIPIRDKNPSSIFPYVTVGIMAVNVFIFFIEITLDAKLDKFIMEYGVVPVKVTNYSKIPDLSFIDTFTPFFTSMFLHGGFIHLIGNMWFLWIFGDNIEAKLGHLKYLWFYLLCGILASFVHVFFNSQSEIPCIGASGAIAGVLGAYMVTFPRARVVTIVPLWFILQVIELPAVVVLGFWFVIQFVYGAISISTSGTGENVAWWAHIGGFASGIFVYYFFRNIHVKRYRGSRYH